MPNLHYALRGLEIPACFSCRREAVASVIEQLAVAAKTVSGEYYVKEHRIGRRGVLTATEGWQLNIIGMPPPDQLGLGNCLFAPRSDLRSK